jgi:hypothetical protein
LSALWNENLRPHNIARRSQSTRFLIDPKSVSVVEESFRCKSQVPTFLRSLGVLDSFGFFIKLKLRLSLIVVICGTLAERLVDTPDHLSGNILSRKYFTA